MNMIYHIPHIYRYYMHPSRYCIINLSIMHNWHDMKLHKINYIWLVMYDIHTPSV